VIGTRAIVNTNPFSQFEVSGLDATIDYRQWKSDAAAWLSYINLREGNTQRTLLHTKSIVAESEISDRIGKGDPQGTRQFTYLRNQHITVDPSSRSIFPGACICIGVCPFMQIANIQVLECGKGIAGALR